MKKIVAVSLLLVALTGCGRIDSVVNRFESAAGLLNRTVTLYDANGKVIKSWETNNEISYGGPVAGFIDKNGMNVRVAGTIIIEGK
jgi:hypothetical protein